MSESTLWRQIHNLWARIDRKTETIKQLEIRIKQLEMRIATERGLTLRTLEYLLDDKDDNKM